MLTRSRERQRERQRVRQRERERRRDRERERETERETKRERETESVKRSSILWHDVSQRECVGRVIKCTQQGWKQGSKCPGVQRCQVCGTQHSLSAWAGFVPKLTATLTETETKKNMS